MGEMLLMFWTIWSCVWCVLALVMMIVAVLVGKTTMAILYGIVAVAHLVLIDINIRLDRASADD